VLLCVEEHIDEDAILRRDLVGSQIGGDVEAPWETGKFPGVGTGNAHDPL